MTTCDRSGNPRSGQVKVRLRSRSRSRSGEVRSAMPILIICHSWLSWLLKSCISCDLCHLWSLDLTSWTVSTFTYLHIFRSRSGIRYCQALSQIPDPQGPAPTQSNPVKISSKGTGADTKILWATTPPHPIHNFYAWRRPLTIKLKE